MPPRWCFIPSAPSLPGFVRLHGVCVFVCMRRTAISFCTKPAVDSPATDTGSSLEPHTVFHSINFCPPPWAHFTGVNSSPPLGWVCEPAWMCAPARSLSILIEVKSEMFWDSPPRDLWVLWWIKLWAPPKKTPTWRCRSNPTAASHTWPGAAGFTLPLWSLCSTSFTPIIIRPYTLFPRPAHETLKRSFCFSLRIRVDARMHTETGDEDLW